MQRVSLTELKDRLSHFLRLVKQGETVEILERSLPIARIQALPKSSRGRTHLARMVKDGLVQPGTGKACQGVLEMPPLRSKLDPVEVLIEERGER